MAFLNRLILNKQGRLPLVRPRIPSRFENTNPGEQEPGAAPDSARPVSRSIYNDSPKSSEHSSRTPMWILDQKSDIGPVQPDGSFTKSETANNKVDIFSFNEVKGNAAGEGSSESENKTTVSERLDDGAEGILVERHYLTGNVNQPGGYQEKAEQDSSFANKPDLAGRHIKRRSMGSNEESVIVNIGTVEVRAVVEQKEKPRQKSPERKPRISLQDYLDKKNKGT